MNTRPTVSVILPCRNEAPHIEACLRSILAQEPVESGFEVLVADGMSEDETREILKRMAQANPRLRVVDNPGRIVSTGLNAAIRAARGAIIIRMDAHTEYAPDYIRQCVAVLQETGADNVGGPARTRATGYVQHAICTAYHSAFSVGGAKFHNTEYEGWLDTVTYGCWPRKVFDRVGLFDEELVRNQDDEHNLRLTRAGGRVWQSRRIKSWYRPRASLTALFRQYMQYGYWKVRVIQKHRRPASIRHLVPAAFVATLIVLGCASLSWAPALWLLTGVASLYVLCVLVASVLMAVRTSLRLLPILPLVFACYHLGYGYGFLMGVLYFLVLRRKPASSFVRLTRDTVRLASEQVTHTETGQVGKR